MKKFGHKIFFNCEKFSTCGKFRHVKNGRHVKIFRHVKKSTGCPGQRRYPTAEPCLENTEGQVEKAAGWCIEKR